MDPSTSRPAVTTPRSATSSATLTIDSTKLTALQSLVGKNCLNRYVIDLYLALLEEKGKHFLTFSTMFFQELQSVGPHGLYQRRFQKTNIFKNDMLFIPLFQPMDHHWSIVIIDLRKRLLVYYDALPRLSAYIQSNLASIWKFLHGQRRLHKQQNIDLSKFQISNQTVNVLENNYDSGIYICRFAENYSRGLQPFLEAKHIPYYRTIMYHELITSSFLPNDPKCETCQGHTNTPELPSFVQQSRKRYSHQSGDTRKRPYEMEYGNAAVVQNRINIICAEDNDDEVEIIELDT